jgi:hypothetical protein
MISWVVLVAVQLQLQWGDRDLGCCLTGHPQGTETREKEGKFDLELCCEIYGIYGNTD